MIVTTIPLLSFGFLCILILSCDGTVYCFEPLTVTKNFDISEDADKKNDLEMKTVQKPKLTVRRYLNMPEDFL